MARLILELALIAAVVVLVVVGLAALAVALRVPRPTRPATGFRPHLPATWPRWDSLPDGSYRTVHDDKTYRLRADGRRVRLEENGATVIDRLLASEAEADAERDRIYQILPMVVEEETT